MINVPPIYYQQILLILRKYTPLNSQVFAFGSRVKKTARANSDLDLVIEANQSMSLQEISEIKEAFSESDIPFRVDISDWHLLSDNFKQCIKDDLIKIDKNSHIEESA